MDVVVRGCEDATRSDASSICAVAPADPCWYKRQPPRFSTPKPNPNRSAKNPSEHTRTSSYFRTMEGADVRIAEKVQSLSDLELAVLICLVADQHCIIETEKERIRDVQEELKLVRSAII